MGTKRCGGLADQRGFSCLVIIALLFGIGAAMADKFVAPDADACGDLRRVIVDRGVHQMAHRQAEFLEQLENAPDSDP